MSSTYPILEGRPIDQWKVTELKEELRRRKLKTGGLKEELVKRLDADIRNELEEQNDHEQKNELGQENEDEEENELEEENVLEQENVNELEQENVTSNNGFDSAPQSEVSTDQQAVGLLRSDELEKDNTPGDKTEEQNVLTNEELNKDTETNVTHEQERSDVFVSETIQDVTSQTAHKTVKDENSKTEVDEDSANTNEETAEELKVVSYVESSSSDIKQETEVTVTVETEIVTESKVSVTSFSGGNLLDDSAQDESGDLKAELENEDSGAELVDTKVNTSDPNNQVSEVIGFQVKSDSISTESVTINEKNELKDNIIADDVKLELDVKPEMVYPSSSNDIPDDGKSHPMDVDEPQANKVSVEETGADNAENEDLNKENDTGVLGSSEKLNLDRSSGDDFVEDDGMEVKQVESKPVSDEVSFREKEVEAFDEKEEGVVDIVGMDIPDDVKVVSVEEKNGAALPPAKRKLDDDKKKVPNSDPTKRQRRWFSEGVKVSEQRSDDVSFTPKGPIQPALKRSFSRSGSAVGQEAPKERVVPPPSKAPTSALRIDRFLRPFTLKAVQELLGKTGTLIDFWMDNIKTHCYVSYSSVEEAVETRNAVYNLQWPPYGGHLLVAEFVDPLEVKARLEPPPPPPPQAPAAPAAPVGASVTASARNPAPQPVPPTQPSPRLHVQKQQPQQQTFLPPPPPPPLANPPAPAIRDHQQPPPVKERLTLPPPPPLPEKADPPIVTLDDLFRKTKATPRIYYLPLTEDQVAEKLQAIGKEDDEAEGKLQAIGKTVKQ